jgi:hypothetical protein
MQKLNRANGLGVLSELCALLIAALLCAPKQLPGATTGPPTIDYPPRSQEVIPYQQAAFGVIAGGTAPLEYQWLASSSAAFSANGATPGRFWVTTGNSHPYTSAFCRCTSDSGGCTSVFDRGTSKNMASASVFNSSPSGSGRCAALQDRHY